MAELQTRLALEEQREEEKGKEAFALKQKLTEAEMVRDSLKKEVRMEKGEETPQHAPLRLYENFSPMFFST